MAENRLVMVLITILILIVIYFLPPNDNYPPEMLNKVDELSNSNPDDLEFAKATFTFVSNRWTSPIRAYLREITKPFMKDVTKIWNVPDGEYMSSNVESELLKAMLILSNRFDEEDIITVRNFCEISPHSFLEIKINGIDQQIFMDTWLEDREQCQEESCFGLAATIPCSSKDLIGERI